MRKKKVYINREMKNRLRERFFSLELAEWEKPSMREERLNPKN